MACEIDHVQPWYPHRRTSEDNLCCLCPKHHLLKEQPGWQVELREDRSLAWTTPTGHQYTSQAADYRVPLVPATTAAAAPPRWRTLDELFALGPSGSNDPAPFDRNP